MGALQTVVSSSLMCRPPSTPFSFTWWLWQPGCSSVFIFTPLDNSGQYRQNASNGLCTGMVTGEQSCDSVWTLKRILDLVVQFVPPYFFFFFRYCIFVQCWYHYCFSFQVQEINKGAIFFFFEVTRGLSDLMHVILFCSHQCVKGTAWCLHCLDCSERWQIQ